MGSDITRERIRGALASVLYPLARILLRCGVGYPEFAELAKHAYIEAASGRKTASKRRPLSIAQVSVMTGLSRKEVTRICNLKTKIQVDTVSYRNIYAEVLHRWVTDPMFLDESGYPKVLSFSRGKSSFSELVSSVSDTLYPREILIELQRSGAVGGIGDSKLCLLRREYIPDTTEEKAIEGLQFGLRRLTETVFFNSEPENRKSSKFQRIIHTNRISVADINIVQASLTAILAAFATKVDDFLTSFPSTTDTKNINKKSTYHVGVGLYYFDGPA